MSKFETCFQINFQTSIVCSSGRTFHWGEEFFPCHSLFGDLIKRALWKKFNVGKKKASDKLYSALSTARIKRRGDLRVSQIMLTSQCFCFTKFQLRISSCNDMRKRMHIRCGSSSSRPNLLATNTAPRSLTFRFQRETTRRNKRRSTPITTKFSATVSKLSTR